MNGIIHIIQKSKFCSLQCPVFASCNLNIKAMILLTQGMLLHTVSMLNSHEGCVVCVKIQNFSLQNDVCVCVWGGGVYVYMYM